MSWLDEPSSEACREAIHQHLDAVEFLISLTERSIIVQLDIAGRVFTASAKGIPLSQTDLDSLVTHDEGLKAILTAGCLWFGALEDEVNP